MATLTRSEDYSSWLFFNLIVYFPAPTYSTPPFFLIHVWVVQRMCSLIKPHQTPPFELYLAGASLPSCSFLPQFRVIPVADFLSYQLLKFEFPTVIVLPANAI